MAQPTYRGCLILAIVLVLARPVTHFSEPAIIWSLRYPEVVYMPTAYLAKLSNSQSTSALGDPGAGVFTSSAWRRCDPWLPPVCVFTPSGLGRHRILHATAPNTSFARHINVAVRWAANHLRLVLEWLHRCDTSCRRELLGHLQWLHTFDWIAIRANLPVKERLTISHACRGCPTNWNSSAASEKPSDRKLLLP